MLDKLLEYARKNDCSDIHIAVGEPPIFRKRGELVRLPDGGRLTPEHTETIAKQMLERSNVNISPFDRDIDFCYVSPNKSRQRVNIYRQRGSVAVAIRLLNSEIPAFDSLNLPEIFKEIAGHPRGLVLVTGPTGSGKSTTLAAMIDYINSMRSSHILTLEDPIEYLHHSKKSMVNQREVNFDVESFAGALRSALREDPDVILVGEMRDLETIHAAITAAETGHFVMSTLHTIGAAKTIDRVIDVFPPHQQQQVRVQLATVLKAVITQTLLPRADGSGRVPAFEIMVVNDAIANLIREGKTFQINSVLQTSTRNGMICLDMYLAELLKKKTINLKDALDKCTSRDEFRRYAEL